MKKYLAANLRRIEAIIAASVARDRTPLKNKLRQYFAGGGKIRPRIMLAVGKMAGAKQRDINQLAASLEMLHTATLIHDDLVDNAAKRRGKKSLHLVTAANVAVLGGDFLLAQALLLAAGLNKAEIVGIIADALARLCEGEISETFAGQKQKDALPAYYKNIAAKTGVLFESACALACAAGGTGKKQTRALKSFGLKLGTAYQMFDDVADFKEDFRGRIMTLPVIKRLAGSSNALAEPVREARVLAASAARELDIFPASPARAYLQSLARQIGN